MKAMIFAAGLGTRLRPITDSVPKAMVEVGGQPILKITLDRCFKAGIREVIVNVHYLPEVIREFVSAYRIGEMKIHISDESKELLETGGGLIKAKDFFNDGESFLIANADVLTNIDIRKFADFHKNKNGMASLAVRDRSSARKLLFSQDGRLMGRADGQKIGREYAFSGYHILSPQIFNHITREGKFSITDWYLDICEAEKIFAYPHQNDIWIDIGTAGKLQLANEVYIQNRHLF